MNNRDKILALLDSFIRQRPGLEYANYCSGWNDLDGRRAYFREMREITRDRHIAMRLLESVRWRESIGEAELRAAFRAYSGRLTLTDIPDGKMRLDYCTGQYFPTEYRRAACAVLAAALWDYARDVISYDRNTSPGDSLRGYFRREYGRTIANRFFN